MCVGMVMLFLVLFFWVSSTDDGLFHCGPIIYPFCALFYTVYYVYKFSMMIFRLLLILLRLVHSCLSYFLIIELP